MVYSGVTTPAAASLSVPAVMVTCTGTLASSGMSHKRGSLHAKNVLESWRVREEGQRDGGGIKSGPTEFPASKPAAASYTRVAVFPSEQVPLHV